MPIDAETLGRASGGEDLSFDQMSAAVETILRGEADEHETALLLMALRAKGETVDEIAGAAAAMRRHMTSIRTRRAVLVDTCGTGGDGSRTFNISTAAALVTAAAGVPVAKHGNRRITSRTGSADVLAALGVNVEASVATVEACLEELGLCFCFAPLMHGAMRNVASVRQKLGVPTIFNLLGPLANPAAAPFQVLGVGRADMRPKLAGALARLGTQRAFVVCGSDGLDEVTLAAPTHVTEVTAQAMRELVWQPEDFGLHRASLESLVVDDPAASAALIRRVLEGEAGPARDIVVLNAAAAILATGQTDSPPEAAQRALAAIDTGAAHALLARLVLRTHA